jgi:hypothetical protein
MTATTKARLNENTLAETSRDWVSLSQRDPLDESRTHLVFLTKAELVQLLDQMVHA